MRAFIQTFLSALLFTAACCNSAWAETVRPDIVVADFENETLDNWTAQGDAFTVGESRSLYRGGMGFVFGFHGRSLVNTLAAPKDDSSTGTLTSPKFTIERNYVTFLVGGGAFPGETGVTLYVDGQKVAETTGLFNVPRVGNEGLVQRFWDVKAYQGKTAQIVIFDKKSRRGLGTHQSRLHLSIGRRARYRSQFGFRLQRRSIDEIRSDDLWSFYRAFSSTGLRRSLRAGVRAFRRKRI